MNRKYRIICLGILFVLSHIPLYAQSPAEDLNINGDTLHVPLNNKIEVRFMGEIQTTDHLCDDGVYRKYKLRGRKTTATIELIAEGADPCSIIIAEGDIDAPRRHTFILKPLPAQATNYQHVYDFSTEEKIKERVKILKEKAEASNNATESADTEENNNNTNTNNDPLTQLLYAKMGEVKDLVKQKVENFTTICYNLANRGFIKDNMDKGLKLFNYDMKKTVQTQSKSSAIPTPRPIEQYFKKLTVMGYKKVTITSKEIQFISNIVKGADGAFHATAVLLQEFEGQKLDGRTYHDLTKKRIDIIIKVYDKQEGNKTKTFIDIFLGDVTVDEVS